MFWLIFIFNYDTFLFINDTIFQEVIERQTDSYIPVLGKEKRKPSTQVRENGRRKG